MTLFISMRRFLAVAVCLLAVGCGGAKYQASPPTAADRDQRFLHLAYKHEPSLKSENGRGLIGAAHTVCEAFDEGIRFNLMAETMVRHKVSAAQAGTVIAAAVRVYCPRNLDVIP